MNLYSVFLFAVHTAATSRKVGATPPPIVKQCFPSRPVYTKTGGSGGQWRNLLPAVFATWSSHELSRSLQGGDVYEFGVFKGKSIQMMAKMRAFANSTIWGFDSFAGLPDENVQLGNRHHTLFRQGNYRADPRVQLQKAVPNVKFVAGFYNVSLSRPGLVSEKAMQPAKYVDIDVDLYVSTKDVLDFLFSNRLARVGTVIAYDDFWSHTCTHNAPKSRSPLLDGEGLAHKQAALKYGINFACIAGSCRMDSDCQAFGAIFVVMGVNTVANHGFNFTKQQVKEWKTYH